MELKFRYSEEDITWKVIGQDEFKKLMDKLDQSKKVLLHTNNLKMSKFGPGNWIIYTCSYTRDQVYIVVNKNYKLYGYRCKMYVSHYDQDLGHKANPALTKIKEHFRNHQNSSFKTCFGTVDKNILRCVPKQLYWSKKGHYEGSVSSIDFSSQYPAQLCGILPDSHTAVVKEGTVKPSKEYPFAFYVNSGHLAIYKELDTHTWLFNTRFEFKDLFRTKTYRTFDDTFHPIPPEEDVTILMKAAKKTLKDEIEYFYNIKQTYPKDSQEYVEAKLVLNAAIGQMHRKLYTRDKYAHLAAVAIARANQSMLNLVIDMDIPVEDIIQIQIDGILYKTDKVYGLDKECLGKPFQEAINRPCRWESLGCYMIQLEDGSYKIKNQGYNRMKDGRLPEESTCFEDMDLWIKE